MLGEDRILTELRLHRAPARRGLEARCSVPLPPAVKDAADNGHRRDDVCVERLLAIREAEEQRGDGCEHSTEQREPLRPEITQQGALLGLVDDLVDGAPSTNASTLRRARWSTPAPVPRHPLHACAGGHTHVARRA